MRVLVTYGSETAVRPRSLRGSPTSSGATNGRWTSGRRECPRPTGYDVVILGGAVYLRRWQHDARRFLRKHRATLTSTRVWLFSSGPVDPQDRPFRTTTSFRWSTASLAGSAPKST